MSGNNNQDFDLELEDDVEIIIEDDTPAEDRGKQLLSPDQEDDADFTESEVAQYSENVQKRIKRLAFEKHDQRRKREAAEREAEEAGRIARVAIEQLNAMRKQASQYEAGFVDQAKTRLTHELAAAKRDFKAAFDSGDADAMAEAQEKISRLAPQHEQYERYVPSEPEDITYPEPRAGTGAPAQGGSYDIEADRRQMRWMQANGEWFQKDERMTQYVIGVHTQLAMNRPSGFVGSDEYYAEIDRSMREMFPDSFESAPRPRTTARTQASPVTPVGSRTPSRPAASGTGARRQVRLSATQLKLASKLGLTPQQYAEGLLEQGE